MADTREVIYGIFGHNWGIKITALVLALLTFFVIHGATNEELTYKVPVVVEAKEGIAILDKDPSVVEVTFRGSFDDLRRIDPAKLKARITPTVTESAGSEKIHLQSGDITGTVGSRAVKIMPGVVELSFDIEAEEKFSVAKPTAIGKPLKGEVQIDYEPKVVTIRGPRQQLQRMLSENVVIETEPVDVDARAKSFTRSVYAISPSKTWVSQIEPAEIQVTVNIVTESISREWTNLVISAVVDSKQKAHLEIEPSVVHLSLHGRPDLVKSIEDSFIKIFVDCTGLEIGEKKRMPVNVHLPPATADVTVTVDPAFVAVLLKKPEGIDGKEESN